MSFCLAVRCLAPECTIPERLRDPLPQHQHQKPQGLWR